MSEVLHVCPVSGKDSLATALVQRERQPETPITYIYNVTGRELPEVNAWLASAEAALNAPIIRIGADLTEIIYDENMLPNIKQRYCTRKSKIYPMEEWIANRPTILYLGLRADEDRAGYTPPPHVEVRYPLREVGFGLDDVYALLDRLNLLPPTFRWSRIEERVRFALGADAGKLDALPRWQQDQLLSGRSRANCDFCFFQRAYEWVWLAETHPERFEESMRIEQEIGGVNTRRDRAYTWRPRESLAELIARREQIITRRVRQIVHTIYGYRQSTLDDPEPEIGEEIMKATSCGLFCAK